jgi:membrane protein implicated in regulation of membrane protease activity
MPETPISSLPDLMEAFDFTVEDLDYNQRRLISPGQRSHFSDSRSNRAEFVLPLFNLGLFCGVPTAFAVVALDRFGSNPIVALVLIVVIVVLVGLGYFTARRMLRSAGAMRRAIAQDVAAGRVAMVQARITEDEGGEHVIAVDDARGVELFHEEFKRLDRSRRYQVYYLPESKIVVSIEADSE